MKFLKKFFFSFYYVGIFMFLILVTFPLLSFLFGFEDTKSASKAGWPAFVSMIISGLYASIRCRARFKSIDEQNGDEAESAPNTSVVSSKAKKTSKSSKPVAEAKVAESGPTITSSNEAKPRRIEELNVSYDLKDVKLLLKDNGSLYKTRKVKPTFIDHYLYSGKFNSVLGLDGFNVFKKKLKEVIKNVNTDNFGSNYINLTTLQEALLDSGVYYMDDFLPSELESLKSDTRWLTAYRYMAKNFPNISYDEFKVIVKRFKNSQGASIYVKPSDSDFLNSLVEKSELFEKSVDIKSTLMHLNQFQLKKICEKAEIQAARSNEETVERIMFECGDEVLDLLPKKLIEGVTLVIKDTELATGEDFIHLDSYLKKIAKVMRQDLTDFIDKNRRYELAA